MPEQGAGRPADCGAVSHAYIFIVHTALTLCPYQARRADETILGELNLVRNRRVCEMFSARPMQGGDAVFDKSLNGNLVF